MITDSSSGIKREVLQLIDLQIKTLKQESSLDSSQLHNYQARSETIRQLDGELGRIRGARIEFKFASSSVPEPSLSSSTRMLKWSAPPPSGGGGGTYERARTNQEVYYQPTGAKKQ